MQLSGQRFGGGLLIALCVGQDGILRAGCQRLPTGALPLGFRPCAKGMTRRTAAVLKPGAGLPYRPIDNRPQAILPHIARQRVTSGMACDPPATAHD